MITSGLVALVLASCTSSAVPTTTPTTPTTLLTSTSLVSDPLFEFGASRDLSGSPMGLAYRAETGDLYVTLAEGQILKFTLSDGMLRDPIVVATDLIVPRGIAVDRSSLYVVETGRLPCDGTRCKFGAVPGSTDPYAAELEILEQSRSKILKYEIQGDGLLAGPAVLVADLPVANSDHAVNGLTLGPSGSLFAAIGHIDGLLYSMGDFIATANPSLLGTDRVVFPGSELVGVDHPNLDLLGTVIEIDVDTGEFRVVARGVRNVYEITHDDLGVLWGVDNDGLTLTSWRREELLRIHDGAHFGFPYDGSSPPFAVRTDPAVWTLDERGSAGVEFVTNVDGGAGLLIGAFGHVSYLELTVVDGAARMPFRKDALHAIGDVSGYAVSIEQVGPRMAIVAVLGANRLRVLTWD